MISRDYIIRSGEIAYNISRDYAKVKVLEKNGRGYKIKFLSGSLAGEVGSGWRRSDLAVSHGCYEKFCVNDSFYLSGRNSEKVKIVGLQSDGRFVLKFLDGPNSGELGGKWERKDLAVLEGCYQGVCVGDYVYNTKRDGAKVKILGKTLDNSFVIKFVSGELSGQRGNSWNAKYFALKEGCYKDLCVGDIVYKLDNASPKVKILGKTQNHKFVIKFLSGSNSGRHGTNWDREDFALTNGCHGKLCVGDIAYNTSRDNIKVKLVAKAMNNTFVIKFLQSNLSGKFGHNWSEDDLARTSGCYKSFCVGDIAYNTQRDNVKVKILAIEKKNTFVLKFLNGSLSGKKGNNWSYSNLKK